MSSRRMFSPDGDNRIGGRPTSSAARESIPFGSHVADTSMRKVRSLHPAQFMPPPPDEEGSDAGGSARSATPVERPDSGTGVGMGAFKEREFSLSHLLTNALILQVGVVLSYLIPLNPSLTEA